MWKWVREMSGVQFAVSVRVSSPFAARVAEGILARHPSAGQAFGSSEADGHAEADPEGVGAAEADPVGVAVAKADVVGVAEATTGVAVGLGVAVVAGCL